MAEFIFWSCLLLPLYAWLGYPLVLSLLAPFRHQPQARPATPLTVSVVIAAHNEQRHIAQKLRSVLSQADASASLQVIVASDGSSDRTVACARSIDDPRILALDLPRIGKAAALNIAVERCQGEILVFTDADNQWVDDTLGHLLRPFAMPGVGGSAGQMIIPRTGKGLSLGDSLYRHYEGWVRRVENRNGCMVSADGALLALRRELYEAIPEQVNDDFFISTCAPAAGQRMVYVPEALVLDCGVDEPGKQFRRRQRVTVGGLRSLAARSQLLDPTRHGLYAIALISHKLLRRLAPLLLVPLLLSNLCLLDSGAFYLWTCTLQLLGYGIALIGLLDAGRRLPRPFRLAAYVLVTCAGMSVGLWQFLRGQGYRQWNPEQNR